MSEFSTKGIYASGMVLQRLAKNCIFGAGAKPETPVSLKLGNICATSNAAEDGSWKIEYETGAAGGPFTMELENSGNKITFTDVYVGEVWVSSGQSNAELMMTRMQCTYPDEFKLPANPNIRMITVPISYNFDGEQDSIQNPVWRCASPETLAGMAGTGYFFAKKLSAELGVPVGVINVAQGGSPIASWMSKKALQEVGTEQNLLDELAKWENPKNIAKEKQTVEKNQSEWNSLLYSSDEGVKNNWEKIPYSEIASSWENISIPGDLDVLHSAGTIWLKKEITLTAAQVEHFNSKGANLWLGTILDADTAYVNGAQVGITYYTYPPRRYSVPQGILKEGGNTITLKIQKNSKNGAIRFYEEKPYCLFTADLKVEPSVCHNVEKVDGRIICGAQSKNVIQGAADQNTENNKDSEFIGLAGEWKMAVGCKVPDSPAGRFFEWVPTALFNGMLSPCFNYAISGALWYQGESDAYNAERYKSLLVKMIMLWREKFVYAPSDMPFVIMQLPNWSDGYAKDPYSEAIGWPAMRQSQLLVSEIAGNVGLAVTIDSGEWNDLHPEKKKSAGTRAAMEASRIAYNKPYNPAPKAVYTGRKGNKFVVQFETGSATLKSALLEIPGFYFLEKIEDKVNKVSSTGRIISDNEVEVDVPECKGKLIELRYLWADSPDQIVLYSSDNLPAAPFRAVIPE